MALFETVQSRLQEEGISCLKAFPNRKMPRLLTPTVMLCVTERSFAPMYHGNFFGKKGTSSVYVRRCSEKLACEIYSPYLSGGAACDDLADAVYVRLAEAMTDQIVCLVERKPTYYDPDTDCFRASVEISSDGLVMSSIVRGDA